MRIGEEVFAVFARGRQRTRWTTKSGPNGGRRRRPSEIMCVLTECAIRVSGTVRMDVHESGPWCQKAAGLRKGQRTECESGDSMPAFCRPTP